MDAGWLAVGTWTVIGPWCAGRWIRPMQPRCCSRPVAASPMWCGRPVGSSGSSPTPPGFRKRTAGASRGGPGGAGRAGPVRGPPTAGPARLGRFAYAADLLVSPQPFRASGDFALISSVLGNPTLDFSAWTSWADLGSPPSAPNVTLSELDRYAALGASFVTRRWRSLASVRLAAALERFDSWSAAPTVRSARCFA